MTRTITYQKAINEAIQQEMAADPTVVLFGEDVAGGEGSATGEDDTGRKVATLVPRDLSHREDAPHAAAHPSTDRIQ